MSAIRRCLLALALVALALGALSTAPAAAQDPSAPGGASPRLTLAGQPVAVEPDGDFGVLLTIDDAPTATNLAVDIYDRVEEGDVVGSEPTDGREATFDLVDLPDAPTAATQAAGFSIQLYTQGQENPNPAWGYRIDEPGVYPVRVRLWDDEGNTLATMMTSIVRLPEDDQRVATTQVALLAEGHRAPPEDTAARAAGDQADPGLIEQVGPVLDALETRSALPATWALTPDAVARLADDEPSADDLELLRDALAGPNRTLLDAPYVDIDPASLVAARLDGELTSQRDLGQTTLTDLLQPPIQGTWQIDHRVDEPTLGALRDRKVDRVILPSDALPGNAGVLDPVDLPAAGGSTRASAISVTYTLGAAAPDDPLLAGHRLLARLAAVASNRTEPAHVIVTLDGAVAQEPTLDLVLDALTLSVGRPFFEPVPLDDVLDAPAAAAPAPQDPSPPPLGRYPAELRQARRDLASYTSMIGDRPELTSGYEQTLAVSAAADLDLAEREHDAASVSVDLDVPFSSISIPAADKVTLGGRDATFPLPIESSLDVPAQVVIELDSNDRLEFPNDRIEATLDNEREVVQIHVRTRTSGDTPVRVTVRTPDDGVVLAEGRYVIRSTAVSNVGIFLTVGAALFLAVWWGRHWIRGRRGGPDAESTEAPVPADAL